AEFVTVRGLQRIIPRTRSRLRRLLETCPRALHAALRPGHEASPSTPAEPVVALLLPVAGVPVVDDGELHHVLRVLEAELGRDAYLHREAVLARQDFPVEAERHLGLRVQRSRHVDRGGIALGTAEPDVLGAGVDADPAQEFREPHPAPFADRAPALDTD